MTPGNDAKVVLMGVTAVLLFSMPFLAQAQSGSAQDNVAGVLGNGDKPALSFANEHLPANVMLVQTGYEVTYDTNPLSISGPVTADEEERAVLDWLVLHQGSRVQAKIEYRPYYEFYARNDAYSRFNQLLSADCLVKLSSRWSSRIRDDFTQATDPNAPETRELAPTGTGSPSGLNGTVYSPLNHERENSARVDFRYQGSLRTSLGLFAGYDNRSLSGGPSLGSSTYMTRGLNAGAEYAWRSSEHSTLGILGMVQRVNLSGILPEESGSRMDIVSLLPVAGWHPRPYLEMSAFAGPQFIRQSTPNASPATSSSVLPQWAAGGTMTRRGERTSLFMSAQHVVNDGGGLLTFVTNSFVETGLRRKFYGNWDATLDAMIARNNWLPLTVGQGKVTTSFARLELFRPLRRGLMFHFGYELERQTYSGTLPRDAGFYRNDLVTAISWQWRPIPLGR